MPQSHFCCQNQICQACSVSFNYFSLHFVFVNSTNSKPQNIIFNLRLALIIGTIFMLHFALFLL